jgi:hypothetical protein
MLQNRPALLAWALAATVVFATAAAPAQTDPPEAKLRCVEAYEQSQRDRRDGRLLEAREQLVACSQAECPEVVRQDCTNWLGEVEKAVPSIVVTAKSHTGDDLVDAEVLIDESLVPSDLSGKAFELNPGKHRIQVEVEGYLPYDRTVVVVEGEKLRAVIATLKKPKPKKPPPPPPPPPPVEIEMKPPSPVPPILFGVVGAAGFGGLTYFGLKARAAESDLDKCRPDCTQSGVDDTRRKYLLANVSLGVGIAGATSTLVWLLVAKPRPVESSRQVRLDLEADPGGASALVRGRF